MVTNKKVKLNLMGLDGNAFYLLGAFGRAAKNQGWKEAEIKAVRDEATKGDYNHLVATLMDNTEEVEVDADEDDEDEDEDLPDLNEHDNPSEAERAGQF
jgi:hypothetical protein